MECLNRTFYGIETSSTISFWRKAAGLNRTFYGIETINICRQLVHDYVLIVPFMELKLYHLGRLCTV